jgi:hypothetical protein
MAPRNAAAGWSHTPSTATLLWLAVSLPLVAWDTSYVLMRPHTMPGGSLHWPLWAPYELYGEVDHMYGFKQWNLSNPFTAAQTLMNLGETVMYLAYLGLWYAYGREVAPGARRAVGGQVGALTVLLGFSAAVMTVSKTVLYCECLPASSKQRLTDQGCSSTARGSTTSARTTPRRSSFCGSSQSRLPSPASDLMLTEPVALGSLPRWRLWCLGWDPKSSRAWLKPHRRA